MKISQRRQSTFMADITRGLIQELQNDPLSFFRFPQKDKTYYYLQTCLQFNLYFVYRKSIVPKGIRSKINGNFRLGKIYISKDASN